MRIMPSGNRDYGSTNNPVFDIVFALAAAVAILALIVILAGCQDPDSAPSRSRHVSHGAGSTLVGES